MCNHANIKKPNAPKYKTQYCALFRGLLGQQISTNIFVAKC